jgi:hypothetical protein
MRSFFLLVLLTAAVVAPAQQEGLKKKPKPAPKAAVNNAPVTKAEGKATFARLEKILLTVTGAKGNAGASSLAASAQPITRAEAIAEMSRLFTIVEPKFKITPKKIAFEEKRLTLREAAQRDNLKKLIAMGFVAKLGPIATNKSESLTVSEFGDAVGFFATRVADLTNLPSSKWTPFLKRD